MGVVRHECAATPCGNANAGRTRKAGEAAAGKNAARVGRFRVGPVGFTWAAELPRRVFEVQRFQSEDREGILRRRRRESLLTARREVAMHSPETKTPGQPAFFSLIEQALVKERVVFERGVYLVGF